MDSAFLERIQSMTELPIRPLTDLLEEPAGNELLTMLQGYGAVLE